MTKTRNLADLGGGFIQVGTGAVQRTVESKLQDVVSVKDFNGSISAAVNSLPASGGIVVLPAGTFVSPYSTASPLTKSGVTFQGAGMPTFNSGYTALENGTIIQGTLNFKASDCSFKDLGIDCGSAVCTALNGGAAMEGLVSGSGINNLYYHNNHIQNVSVLCKDPGATVHAILFESQEEGSIINVATVYAAAGVVLKARRVNVDGVYARSHANYCFLIKSDKAGGTCDEINASNLILDTTGDPSTMIVGSGANWDSNGLVLLSTTTAPDDYPITNVNISNVTAKNVKTGIRFDTVSGGYIKNVNISNVSIDHCYFAGIEIDQNSSLVNVVNALINDTDYNALNQGDKVVFQGVTSTVSQHHCFFTTGDDVVFTDCTADTPYSISFYGFYLDGTATLRNANYRNITTNKYLAAPGSTVTIEDVPALTVNTSAVLSYLRGKLIADIESISGTGSVAAAWFGPADATSTTMIDYSNSGANVATLRDGSFAPNTRSINTLGLGLSTSFNSANIWDAADSDDFSFGNGTLDSPFSVMALVNPVASYLGTLLGKSDSTTGSTKREYLLLWANTSGLYFVLTDESTGGTLGRRQSGSLAGDAGAWHYYTGTYDGSSVATGIKVYRDGVETTDSDISSGVYTAMENTTAKPGSYVLSAAGAIDQAMTMQMAVTIVWNVELSAANVSAIQALLKPYFGV
jgi:hypothetical protein